MTDSDLPFAAAVYASTREEELAVSGWPDAMKHAFLKQQHEAQHAHYRAHYDGADWLIVERDDRPIGRLYRVAWPGEIRIIDVALLPEARGMGIGGDIVASIIGLAGQCRSKVSIHLEKNNSARRLYDRLGFRVTEDRGVYDLMEWLPPAPGGA